MSWPAARQAEMQWGSNGKTPFCPCVIRKQLLGLLIWTWRWCNTWERSCRASRSSSQISWLKKKKKCCHRRHRHHRRHHLHRHKMKNAKSVQRHFASLRAFWSFHMFSDVTYCTHGFVQVCNLRRDGRRHGQSCFTVNTTDCVGKSSKEPVSFSGIRLLVVFLFMLAAFLQLLARKSRI